METLNVSIGSIVSKDTRQYDDETMLNASVRAEEFTGIR